MFIKSTQILPSTLILFFSCFGINTLNAANENNLSQKQLIINELAQKSNTKKQLSTNKKIDSTIQRLMVEPNLMKTATALNAVQTKNQSMVQVYVKVLDTAANQLTELENLGLEIEITNSNLNKIQGWINLNDINRITQLDNVVKVLKPSYGNINVGSRTTEGDAILQSDLVRNLGFTGEGVRVGVISDGSVGLSASQASGDLPDNVVQFASCDLNDDIISTCAEGTAMAEIIHDIAPDAELAIADALTTTLEFIQRLDQLANDFEADIIVDDLAFFLEPYFEDGDIAQAVNALPDNIVYISAAGNNGENHYQSNFESGSTISVDATDLFQLDSPLVFPVTTHDFGTTIGQAPSQSLPFTVAAGATSCAILQWNDPFADGTNENVIAINDYDIYFYDSPNLDSLVAAGISIDNTIEGTCVTNENLFDQTFYLVVGLFSGNAQQEIEIHFSTSLQLISPQFQVVENSIFGHAASERAVAVGTINVQDFLQNDIASFSSQGPSRIDFPVRQDRQKPEITGVDGVSVTGNGGFPQIFFGTSAAAPHIAGITALLKSANPSATRDQIENALLNGAVDLGTPGTDNTFGTGRANAEDSLQLILNDDFSILDFLPAIIQATKNQN